jgi:hypothetical protein
MSDRLAGITAKIERAEKHVNDFTAEWIAFSRRAYEVIADEELDEAGRRNFRLRIKEDAPLSLSTNIGDAVSNMRSALDYLVYQLLDSRGVEVGRHHYFPISGSAEKFETSYGGKIKGVGDEAVSIIKGLKPYKGGTDGFWHLDELCRTDKHRLLLTVVTRPESTGLSLADVYGSMQMPWLSDINREAMLDKLQGQFLFIPGKPAPCPVLEDGDVVYSQPGEMDSYQNTQLAFTIAFGESEVLPCEAVTPVLRQLLDMVKRSVEPFRPLLA